jgi:hypothetical protein
VFRSALNADEVAVLNRGEILQASLEIYSPLADRTFTAGAFADNRAQSLSGLRVGSGRIVHAEDSAGATQ